MGLSAPFDIYAAFNRILNNDQISTPLAAILALTELIENSDAGTMFELVKALNDGAEALQKQASNPISLNAGCELFIAFVTLFPHDSANFTDLKKELIRQGQNYATEALTYRKKIAELAFGFIKDGSILTHSYSRVVMQTLLLAHKHKRISVFVTEARPRGLGIKTAEALTAAGVPSTVILDSAVAYVMDKVDFVLVGSEAVVESGGLVNAVGSNQIAIIARAANKPFYALAESYKFHRLFPLSQYDLPSHNSKILSFPRPLLAERVSLIETPPHDSTQATNDASTPTSDKPDLVPPRITQEQISENNPDVDYTRPDLISLVFSDVGSLTPEGVSQYLVGMFAG
ncbi:nagb/rpia/CoA transferase-like protein [Pholiota conissans]|uniref:Translation initiation factor eIF2B subunit alpha n=1 Tax=Pholiota conissans TaxID=109636 RepID=A0A9P5Z2D8_9AGAR|nr:nagb/rpia/CoA transferase-like protein [Pholiota conissans]